LVFKEDSMPDDKLGQEITQVTNRRIVTAFLTAPLVVPFVLFVAVARAWRFTRGPGLPKTWEAVILVSIAGSWAILPFVYLAEALLGWPAWVAFRRYGIRSVIAFIAVGASIGFVLGVLNRLAPVWSRWDSFFVFLCIVAGGIAGAIFRAIAFLDGQRSQIEPSTESSPEFPRNPFLD
jgi:hypothetical protein